MCKKLGILEAVCFPHLPHLFAEESTRQFALAHPEIFNIEHLVELALANVGGYNFVDEDGRDFDDEVNSVSKTCTLRKWGRGLTISNIENKIGAFRIVVWNEITENVDFLYMPRSAVEKWTEHGFLKKSPKTQRLRGTYNADLDSYNKLEKYQVATFKELATCMH